MGLFDVFCAESGLVLAGDTRLILLGESSPGAFEPIAIPVAGDYDRLGGIDLPEPFGANVQHIATFCCRLDFDDLPRDATFEERLSEMSRGVSEGCWGRLWGRRISYALVEGGIYTAVAESAEETYRSAVFEELFVRAFPLREMSEELYGELEAHERRVLKADLLEFVRYREFGTALSPVNREEGGLFTGYATGRNVDAAEPHVAKARLKYADHPGILHAVEANADYWRGMDA